MIMNYKNFRIEESTVEKNVYSVFNDDGEYHYYTCDSIEECMDYIDDMLCEE